MLEACQGDVFEADIEMPMPQFASLACYYCWFMAPGVINVVSEPMMVMVPGIVIVSVVMMMVRAMSIAAVMDVGMIASAMLVIKSAHAMP